MSSQLNSSIVISLTPLDICVIYNNKERIIAIETLKKRYLAQTLFRFFPSQELKKIGFLLYKMIPVRASTYFRILAKEHVIADNAKRYKVSSSFSSVIIFSILGGTVSEWVFLLLFQWLKSLQKICFMLVNQFPLIYNALFLGKTAWKGI